MQTHRTIIIDLKKIFKQTAIILVMIAVLISGIFINSKESTGEIFENNFYAFEDTKRIKKPFADILKNISEKTIEIFIGFLPYDTASTLRGVIPVYASFENNILLSYEQNVTASAKKEEDIIPKISEENRAPIKEVSLSPKSKISIGNETSYSIDVEKMLATKPDINMKEKGPKILITHTHATESYSYDGAKVYDITSGDRSDDKTKNVVAVGKALADAFRQRGIDVIHDTVLHDKPSFNGSYAHSLSSINEYIKKYPTIEIVFDIHRDSIVYDDNTKAKPVTLINNKKAAQLMFVVGTDENGLQHPDWRENLKSALHFQKAVTEKYPNLMRHINLRRERFNGHTSQASVIIEFGSSGNSLKEAVYSAELFAECVANYLNSL